LEPSKIQLSEVFGVLFGRPYKTTIPYCVYLLVE
jgi:hypothetical protein